MNTITPRPNLGIIGFGNQSTCLGVYKNLVGQLGTHLQEDFDVSIYGCKKEGIEEDMSSTVKKHYIPGHLNQAQSLTHKLLTIFRILSTSDLLLTLGSSNSFFIPLFRFYRKKKVVVFLDRIAGEEQGLNSLKTFWVKWSEKIAVRYADKIITENSFIKEYIENTYSLETEIIPFGGDQESEDASSGAVFSFADKEYVLGLTSDFQPEKTEMILKAFTDSPKYHLVLLGKWDTNAEMQNLQSRYGSFENIHLMSFDSMKASFSAIKKGAYAYLHHHAENTTHPLLLEVMNMTMPVIAIDTPINRSTTGNKALYYKESADLKTHLEETSKSKFKRIAKAMRGIIRRNHSWIKIAEKFHSNLMELYNGANAPIVNAPKEEKKEVFLIEEGEIAYSEH